MVGSVYATDCSNASATGIFEPYTVCAAPQILFLYIIFMRELLTFLLFPYYFRNVGAPLCVAYFPFQHLFILQ